MKVSLEEYEENRRQSAGWHISTDDVMTVIKFVLGIALLTLIRYGLMD